MPELHIYMSSRDYTASKNVFAIDSKMHFVPFPYTPILPIVSIFVALPPPDEVLFTHLTLLARCLKIHES